MHSLNAVVLRYGDPVKVRTFFGKGQNSEAAVRSRLLPEHDGAQIMLGEPIASRAVLNVRYLMLLDDLKRDFPDLEGPWYPLDDARAALYIKAAMLASATPPEFLSSAESLMSFRQHLGVDQGTMAAMLGTEQTRMHRLEQGKSKFTFEDFRRLRYWAARMDALMPFMTAFPLHPLSEASGIEVAAPTRYVEKQV